MGLCSLVHASPFFMLFLCAALPLDPCFCIGMLKVSSTVQPLANLPLIVLGVKLTCGYVAGGRRHTFGRSIGWVGPFLRTAHTVRARCGRRPDGRTSHTLPLTRSTVRMVPNPSSAPSSVISVCISSAGISGITTAEAVSRQITWTAQGSSSRSRN